MLTWTLVASDGKIVMPIMKFFNKKGFSTGHIFFLAVVLEDIPQIILTFLIEGVHGEDGITSLAVINLMTATYDILIKLAEAYDNRDDKFRV
mmetsp:Transcript_32880/g.48238  ORF Transcript_32880/g.48238 Transcript_32880/m.48238 type:complete len:92 (-) Transcript_32880:376-651(-)